MENSDNEKQDAGEGLEDNYDANKIKSNGLQFIFGAKRD